MSLRELTVPVPQCEIQRLVILRESKLMDSNPDDESFSRFVRLLSRVYKVRTLMPFYCNPIALLITIFTLKSPISFISLIDASRQWFKARVGIPQAELPRNTSFCAHLLPESAPNIIVCPDLTRDPRFCTNMVVTGPPFLRFYAGAALTVAGHRVGTICIADVCVRNDFTEKDAEILQDLAFLVAQQISETRKQSLMIEHEIASLTVNIMKTIVRPLGDASAKKLILENCVAKAKDQMSTLSNPIGVDSIHRELWSSFQEFQKSVEALENFVGLSLKVVEDFAHSAQLATYQPGMSLGNMTNIADDVCKLLRLTGCHSDSVVDDVYRCISHCSDGLTAAATEEQISISTYYELLSLILSSCIGLQPKHCVYQTLTIEMTTSQTVPVLSSSKSCDLSSMLLSNSKGPMLKKASFVSRSNKNSAKYPISISNGRWVSGDIVVSMSFLCNIPDKDNATKIDEGMDPLMNVLAVDDILTSLSYIIKSVDGTLDVIPTNQTSDVVNDGSPETVASSTVQFNLIVSIPFRAQYSALSKGCAKVGSSATGNSFPVNTTDSKDKLLCSDDPTSSEYQTMDGHSISGSNSRCVPSREDHTSNEEALINVQDIPTHSNNLQSRREVSTANFQWLLGFFQTVARLFISPNNAPIHPSKSSPNQ